MNTESFPTIITSLPEFKIVKVTIDKLIVEESYQRAVQESHVNTMVDNYDPIKYRPLTGNPRPKGKIAIVDGLQRTSMLVRLGYKGIVEVVIPKVPWTLAEEAKAFYAMNMENKPLRKVDGFNALVTSGNPLAIEINEVLQPLGLEISTARKDMAISAAASVNAVITKCGGLGGVGQGILRNTLTALVCAYSGIRQSLSSPMVKGVADFLFNLNEKHYDPDILVQTLEATEPTEWVGKGTINLTSLKGGTQAIAAVTRAVRLDYWNLYNETFGYGLSLDELNDTLGNGSWQ